MKQESESDSRGDLHDDRIRLQLDTEAPTL